jgi:hypothetical protein
VHNQVAQHNTETADRQSDDRFSLELVSLSLAPDLQVIEKEAHFFTGIRRAGHHLYLR